jgi:hypothetical protein
MNKPMSLWQRLIAVGCLSMPLALAAQAIRADEPTSRPSIPDSFMRFVDDGQGGGSLQSAEVIFVNPQGIRVHLVAAIHIGEKDYYDGLNQDFKQDDAVLYEMVMPKGSAPPPPQDDQSDDTTRPESDVSKFQRLLKDSLQLDFQLDDIDYTAPNFVHADLDSETFERMQQQRGESFQSLFLQQMINALNQQPKPGEADPDAQSMQDLIHIIARPDMERQIKVVIARQLGDMDSAAMGLDGPQGSVILTERNKAAMAALSDTLADGKKNVAIFFGAAHMPDLSKKLEALGFVPESVQWRQAWDLKIRADQPSAIEILLNKMFGPNDDKQ